MNLIIIIIINAMQSGRSLVWDVTVTVVCPLADSYVASAASEARSVAELAATKKEDKYSGLAADYLFQAIAVETLGSINEPASDFFSLLVKKISLHSGDERETAFLFQRVSVLVQRFNGVLLHDSLWTHAQRCIHVIFCRCFFYIFL